MTQSPNGVHLTDVLQAVDGLEDEQKKELLKYLLSEIGVPIQLNWHTSGTNIILISPNSAEIAPIIQAAAERVRRERGGES